MSTDREVLEAFGKHGQSQAQVRLALVRFWAFDLPTGLDFGPSDTWKAFRLSQKFVYLCLSNDSVLSCTEASLQTSKSTNLL